MTSHAAKPPIVVTHNRGLAFEARIRSHTVTLDQPTHVGGDDTGPTPVELLGAALGSCVALYVQQFCHMRSLPYEGLRVEVQQRRGAKAVGIGEFDVRVVLPAELSEQHMVMLQRVAQSCPVHHTLTEGATIRVELETPAAVPELAAH